MWRRAWVPVLISLVMMMPSETFAWPGVYDGQPGGLRPGSAERGVYVWREPDGFHRVVGVGRGPEPWTLELKATTDGVIHDVDAGAMEITDSVSVEDDEHTLKGKFVLFNHVDGARFRVRDAGWVEYEIWENGAPISADRIFVGNSGRHPLDSRFRIYDR